MRAHPHHIIIPASGPGSIQASVDMSSIRSGSLIDRITHEWMPAVHAKRGLV